MAVRQDSDGQAELCACDDAIGWQLSLMLKSTAEKADFAWTDNLIRYDWPFQAEKETKRRRREKISCKTELHSPNHLGESERNEGLEQQVALQHTYIQHGIDRGSA